MGFYFGSHVNILDVGIKNMIKIVKKAGGNLIQIFIPLRINENVHKNKLMKTREYLKKKRMAIVIHSSYQHNLARNWDEHSWWLISLETEIISAYYLGAIGVVIHFGNQMSLSREEAYNNMYTSLIYIHNKTKKYKKVLILLETSTGQGTELCYKLEDLAYFYKKLSKNPNREIRERIKLCVDTCHVFAAGYNLKSINNVKLFIETFEELIGLRHIKLIHLNDCKVDAGEKKDRHQNIGKGYIGYENLKYIFDYFRKLEVPIVLETPNHGFIKEIKMLL